MRRLAIFWPLAGQRHQSLPVLSLRPMPFVRRELVQNNEEQAWGGNARCARGWPRNTRSLRLPEAPAAHALPAVGQASMSSGPSNASPTHYPPTPPALRVCPIPMRKRGWTDFRPSATMAVFAVTVHGGTVPIFAAQRAFLPNDPPFPPRKWDCPLRMERRKLPAPPQ